jgi:hypothetical protein
VWVGPGQGVGRSWLAAKFLKIKSFFFSFFLQKHEKSKKSKNRVYFGGPPSQSTEIGIYFWTLFCPKLVKLQLWNV